MIIYLIDSTKRDKLSFNSDLLMQTLRNKLLFNSQVLVVATKQVNNIYLLYRVSLRFAVLYAGHYANNFEST